MHPQSDSSFPAENRGTAAMLRDAALPFSGPEFRDFDLSLRRLERLAGMGTLAATMAHEIRNSLVAAKTFIDLLLEKQADPEVARVVQRELQRIESLSSQMLRFAGPGKNTFASAHLHSLLDHSLRLIGPQMKNYGIHLERRFLAATDTVNGNESALEQAFVNLLLNAVDAMPSGGTLTVETGLAPAQPSFRVLLRDTGPGIAAEHMQRLFAPFFTTKDGGTGLGLAITRRIVEEHGGTIQVSSLSGQGAEFELRFPTINPPPPV